MGMLGILYEQKEWEKIYEAKTDNQLIATQQFPTRQQVSIA